MSLIWICASSIIWKPCNTENNFSYHFIHLLFTVGHTNEGQKWFSPWLPHQRLCLRSWITIANGSKHARKKPAFHCNTTIYFFFQTKEPFFQKNPDVTIRILVANVHANLSPPFYDINNPKAAIMAIVLPYWSFCCNWWFDFSTLCFLDVHLRCATSKLALVRANLRFTFNWQATSTAIVILCYFSNMRYLFLCAWMCSDWFSFTGCKYWVVKHT